MKNNHLKLAKVVVLSLREDVKGFMTLPKLK